MGWEIGASPPPRLHHSPWGIHRAVFGHRGGVFAGVPGVLLGHGGNHPRYASYVEVPRNFSIISFYTHICMMTRLMT
jgi:hypothetical protein